MAGCGAAVVIIASGACSRTAYAAAAQLAGKPLSITAVAGLAAAASRHAVCCLSVAAACCAPCCCRRCSCCCCGCRRQLREHLLRNRAQLWQALQLRREGHVLDRQHKRAAGVGPHLAPERARERLRRHHRVLCTTRAGVGACVRQQRAWLPTSALAHVETCC
jgi:hypothetical protein